MSSGDKTPWDLPQLYLAQKHLASRTTLRDQPKMVTNQPEVVLFDDSATARMAIVACQGEARG
uniref:hypothetical protein n=1 Tax=Cellvibrio fontiphilus TaxID=1815559 RepID=UPI002B4BE54F|nr:hypothetical protein [Cellvibrio fontiphilus]